MGECLHAVNDHGALGVDNDTTSSGTDISVPILIRYFTENDILIKQISCGRLHSIFVDINGNVYSCGRDQYGQLGINKNSKYNGNKYHPQKIEWFTRNHIKIVKVCKSTLC